LYDMSANLAGEAVVAPIPGLIRQIKVTVGDAVSAGQVVEAYVAARTRGIHLCF